MTESTRQTALTMFLVLGISDLVAINALIGPRLRRQWHPESMAPAGRAMRPSAALAVQVAPPPRPSSAPPPAPAGPALVFFATDVDRLDLEGGALVDRLASAVTAEAPSVLVVDGHADARGRESYNGRLSQRRALAVATRLVSGGVPSSRIVVRAFGASHPAASGSDARSLQRNRRVEIMLRPGAP
jgi:outer membrane protein OmpA-like peptidoglycan-associated protein